MSDRDELIAKARELSAAATPGPWNWANWGDVGDPDDVLEANRPAKDDADRRVWGETVSIKIAKDEDHDLSEADRSFLAESRTLLPALADLAESEGRRADEAEKKLERIISSSAAGEVGELRRKWELKDKIIDRILERNPDHVFDDDGHEEIGTLLAVIQKQAAEISGMAEIVDKVGRESVADVKEAVRQRDAALAELAALKGQQP